MSKPLTNRSNSLPERKPVWDKGTVAALQQYVGPLNDGALCTAEELTAAFDLLPYGWQQILIRRLNLDSKGIVRISLIAKEVGVTPSAVNQWEAKAWKDFRHLLFQARYPPEPKVVETHPLIRLGLSAQLVNALAYEKISSLEALAACTADQLSLIWMIGPKRVEEIRQALAKQGLHLADEG